MITHFAVGKSRRLTVTHQLAKLLTRKFLGSYHVTATVEDRCAGCRGYDLDFSPAAFSKLGSLSNGR